MWAAGSGSLCADGCWCVRLLFGVFVGGGTLPTGACEGPPGCSLAESCREGRVARGGAVLTVEVDAARVEVRLAAGELGCPGCGGVLRPWGWARGRRVRRWSGSVWLRPRRSRCAGCGVSHVLLPVFVLVRRADAVGVIGAALAAKAAGAGGGVGGGLGGGRGGRVGGWRRRSAGRAEAVRAAFTVVLVGVGVDPVVPAVTGSPFGDAVAAVVAAAVSVRSRWPGIGELPVWTLAAAVSGGRLLAPGWP